MSDATVQRKRTHRRYWAIVFMFLFVWIAYLDRINLAVAGVEIIKELHLTLTEFGLISTSFFITYAIFQVPSGIWAERWGPRRLLAAALTWWSTFTMLTAAAWNFISMFIIRLLFGPGESPVYPGSTNLFNRWLKKTEISRAPALRDLGIGVGGATGTLVATAIMVALGWRWIFIIFGIIGFIIALAYFIVIRDMPEETRWVPKEEVEEVKASFENMEKERSVTVRQYAPWKRLLSNPRFWAWGLTHGGYDTVLYAFLTLLPLYYEVAKHIKVTAVPGYAAIVWGMFIVFMLIAGWLEDKLLEKGYTLFRAYVIPASIGLIIGGLFVILGAYVVSPIIATIFIALGFLVNLHPPAIWGSSARMGGIFSGSYAGWANWWGNIIGGLAPFIVTYIASIYGWFWGLFYVGMWAIVAGILWLICQPDKSFAPEIIPNYIPKRRQA